MRCHSVRLEFGGKEKNLQTTWHPSQGQQNPLFSKQFSTSLSSMLTFPSLEDVWLKIIWLNSSHNPEWKASSEAIVRTQLRHENAAWLLSTVQNGGNELTKKTYLIIGN